MILICPMPDYLAKLATHEIRASRLLAELPANELRWREVAYAHYINQLPSVAEYLPIPLKTWYVQGYTTLPPVDVTH